MNLTHLSADEVLRICTPETELEKRLFSICASLEQDIKDMKSENSDLSQALENYNCDNCDDVERKVDEAVSIIKSGKIDEAVKLLNTI
jgi:hypothetical protein